MRPSFELRFRAFCVAALLALVGTPAFALTDTDTDTLGRSDLGYVSERGSIEYDHIFDPFFDSSIEISSIDRAWLTVGVADDLVCRTARACRNDVLFASEVAVISLDSVIWQSGSATASIFFGDVTADANLLANDGVLHVTVRSGGGDFVVLWSTLTTRYTYERGSIGTAGAGSGHAPEPSAALVFAIGALVIGRASRRGAGDRS